MSDPRRDDAVDRELWRRHRAAKAPRVATDHTCLDAADLAGYVDGTAHGSELARIEAHLATCGQCLQAIREARGLLVQPVETVPPAVLVRAKALVAAKSTPPAGPTPTTWRKIGSWVGLRGGEGKRQTALRWAAAAAAAVLVGLAGFFAGSATYRGRQAADARLVAEVSFEPAGFSDDDMLLLADDLELLLPREGGEK